ncbi:Plasmid stabilization system protein [Posidoniimonas polymericola]|uniref:Plasmid stabilization system protein n=1 Tax=Posidoniimonas polymericola TaxID=2528002 RepID=A0A5C5YR39_9BACT|nr:type II toxin-antitoxin system RelE/ParE family toxin [Posidoniimonas polymericola]TWT77333.1 Plasmid stabilization system protein [Posidoniimonas polymericola]
MAELIWTEESLECLRQIVDYLAEQSQEAAASVTEGIYWKAQVLERYPEIGWRHEETPDRNLRSLVYGHYRIVYELIEVDEVRVLAVIHTSMDVSRLRF